MVSSSRPRTPSGSSPPDAPDHKLAAVSEASKKETQPAPRRSSLGLLLRRSKSTELGPRGSKKERAAYAKEQEERVRREAAAIPKSPPRLPDLYNGAAPPQLPYSSGDDRPDSVAIVSGRGGFYQGRQSVEPGRATTMGAVPIPPIPSNGSRHGEWVDPYARTESMTHRGRYSYASSAVSTINSPRRVRRRKDPTPFKQVQIQPVRHAPANLAQCPHHWRPFLWQNLLSQFPQDIPCPSCQKERSETN